MRARLGALHALLVSLWALGVLTAALVAMRQPLFGNDYAFIWGLKGRALMRSGELAALVRVDPMGSFAHPEYPPLWPLVLSTVARLQGGWDDLLLTPLWPLLCLSASLMALRATRGPLAGRLAAAAAVSLLPYWRVPFYPGYAEGLLLVFVLGALGELDRLHSPPAVTRFSAFLCLACLTKNEGAIVAVAFALGLLASAWRSGERQERRALVRAAVVGAAAPLVLAVLPWQLWLHRHLPPGSRTDFSGGTFTTEKAIRVALLVGELVLVVGWAWILCVVALLALAPRTLRRRTAALLACGLYVAAFSGALVFSRHDLVWHVVTTWDRMLFVPGAVLAVVLSEASAEALSAPGRTASDELREPLAGG